MRHRWLQIIATCFSVVASATAGVAAPHLGGSSRAPYVLPYLRGLGEHDPLWGQRIPSLAEQHSRQPISVHIQALRAWVKQHPEQRSKVALYLRMFHELAPRLRAREAAARALDQVRPDELAIEYRLPHDPNAPHVPGVSDPLRGHAHHGARFYVNGDAVTKKAPHVHIAQLEAWAQLHPEGRPVAEHYIAWFRRNAEALYAKDRAVRDERALAWTQIEDVHLHNAVLLRRFVRNGGRIPPAPSDRPEWDAHSHDPAWVRAHLPSVDYLAKESASNPFMQAFRKLVDRSRAFPEKPLAGFRIIGLQHLLSNTGSFIRALANAGVAPHDAVYMGKTYSQNGEVMDELAAEGFGIRAAHFEATAERGFAAPAENRRRELDSMVRDMVRQRETHAADPEHPTHFLDTQHKYLVIDDGGDLIEHIHLYYPELHDRIVAVEQTRKGIRKVKALGVRFPVIDMADAIAKLKFESPMIGLALAKSAVRRLAAYPQAGKALLLLGYGEVGERAAKALRDAGYRVTICDVDQAAVDRARAHGFDVVDANEPDDSKRTGMQRALASAKVVLSTTGTMAIKPADLEHAADGAIFLNGASSATEFASFAEEHDERRPLFRGNSADVQRDVEVRTRSGKRFTFVARGQVINFDNGPGVLPPRYAQLIVGLLYMSSLQAARTTAPGVHALELAPQEAFVADVEADLATRGESLLHPRF